jgi:hypothetical protein
MKYTARHVQKFLIEGKIDAELWTAHFPGVLISHVPTCNKCVDKQTKVCEGGRNPVDCFLEIQSCVTRQPAVNTDGRTPAETNKKYYRSSRGIIKSNPTGIQKGYDQSKI